MHIKTLRGIPRPHKLWRKLKRRLKLKLKLHTLKD
jgi:hypothetical protein